MRCPSSPSCRSSRLPRTVRGRGSCALAAGRDEPTGQDQHEQDGRPAHCWAIVAEPSARKGRWCDRLANGGRAKQHAPGTFSWTDLTTTDQPAAKAFYTGLFGWDVEDMPVGPEGEEVFYSMMSIDGKPVAAISPQPEQQREAGAPPVWNSYVTVENADASLERAKELGGTVHAPAFDVFEAGRMGVIQDPQGAYFLVWQPNQHIGAQLVNAPRALTWNELASPDTDASSAFYGGLFGWTVAPAEGSPMPYWSIKNARRTTGGCAN